MSIRRGGHGGVADRPTRIGSGKNVSMWIQMAATTGEELLAILVIGGALLAALYAFMRSRDNDR